MEKVNERTHEPCGCPGEVRYRAMLERIARGSSYGAMLAREALGIPEPTKLPEGPCAEPLCALAHGHGGLHRFKPNPEGPHPSEGDADPDGDYAR